MYVFVSYCHFFLLAEMNAESSRSHLIIGVVIESINLANGTVHRGKVRRTMNTINITPDKKGVSYAVHL